MEIAPGSDYLKNAGHAALQVNRPREAIAFLTQADPESGWLRWWVPYWGSLTDAHHLLGEHRKELAAARRARQQHPNTAATVYFEMRALAALGRIKEVNARIEEGLTLRDDFLMLTAADELNAHGYGSAASQVAQRAIQWYQGWAPEKHLQRFREYQLARALALGGRLEEARAILERSQDSDVNRLAALGVIAARQGDRSEALTISRQIEEQGRTSPRYRVYRTHREVWHYSYALAQIAATLGEREQALELLRRTVSQDHAEAVMDAHANPDLGSLWDYPAFRLLVRPKG